MRLILPLALAILGVACSRPPAVTTEIEAACWSRVLETLAHPESVKVIDRAQLTRWSDTAWVASGALQGKVADGDARLVGRYSCTAQKEGASWKIVEVTFDSPSLQKPPAK